MNLHSLHTISNSVFSVLLLGFLLFVINFVIISLWLAKLQANSNISKLWQINRTGMWNNCVYSMINIILRVSKIRNPTSVPPLNTKTSPEWKSIATVSKMTWKRRTLSFFHERAFDVELCNISKTKKNHPTKNFINMSSKSSIRNFVSERCAIVRNVSTWN